jgi:hypothetical protein
MTTSTKPEGPKDITDASRSSTESGGLAIKAVTLSAVIGAGAVILSTLITVFDEDIRAAFITSPYEEALKGKVEVRLGGYVSIGAHSCVD